MDSINGIPAHPLFVHLAVVAIPLLAVLGILTVLWPAARRKLGIIVPIVGLVAVVITPLTTSAGESLEAQKRPSELIERHAELGDQMIYFVAPLFVAVVLYWALHSSFVMDRFPSASAGAVRVGSIALAVITVAFAILATIWVYRIGHTGAESVWLH